jgi:F-type H+-transporting ATPase subunit gamma
MSSIRELKTRILSVKETQKITQAMKMVAAAKFKRANQNVINARQFLAGYENVFENLCSRIEPDLIPDFFVDNGAKKQAVIIITGDRGLCGGFNSNNIKQAEKFLKETKTPTELHVFGNKSYTYFKSKVWPIEKNNAYFMEDFSLENVGAALEPILEKYHKKEIGKVYVFYNKFKTALSSDPVQLQILPMVPIKQDEEQESAVKALKSDYFYEPSKGRVLNKYLKYYLTAMLFTALLESSAGEEGSRMAAMDSATDNANDMIKQLSLQYNQSRQAAITKEISEIVGGAEALIN